MRHAGADRIEARALPEGLSIIAAGDLNETATPRLKFALPRFRAAAPPDPDAGDWRAWEDLLGDDTVPAGAPPDAALRFRTARGFATVSSAVIALPDRPTAERRPVFRHATWLPQPSPWRDVSG